MPRMKIPNAALPKFRASLGLGLQGLARTNC